MDLEPKFLCWNDLKTDYFINNEQNDLDSIGCSPNAEHEGNSNDEYLFSGEYEDFFKQKDEILSFFEELKDCKAEKNNQLKNYNLRSIEEDNDLRLVRFHPQDLINYNFQKDLPNFNVFDSTSSTEDEEIEFTTDCTNKIEQIKNVHVIQKHKDNVLATVNQEIVDLDKLENNTEHCKKSEIIKYSCNYCKKTFTSKQRYHIHIRVHTGEKSFQCDTCSKLFYEKSHLIQHIRTHTGEKPFKCPICSKAFTQTSHVKHHLQSHVGIKSHRCSMCEKAFIRKGALTSHIKKHTFRKTHKCSGCEKEFWYKANLKKHMRNHNNDKFNDCLMCDEMSVHMEYNGSKVPYECNFCKKEIVLIEKQKKQKFKGVHECSVCHRIYSRQASLNEHMRKHSGTRPYKCIICQKNFYRKGTMNRHMKVHGKSFKMSLPLEDLMELQDNVNLL